MNLLADENLFGAEAFFGDFGELRLLPGRAVTPADVAWADVLLLRSQTRVDDALLGAARPLFVGTATAGADHVDQAALARRGIPFANAPGCNADPVADWVVTAVAHALLEGRLDPRRARCAIVGGGATGGRVLRRLVAAGFEVGLHDPPLQATGHAPGVPGLDRDGVLAADLVSLHVPLTDSGPHATRHLLDAQAVDALKPGAVLLHAARGGVVDDAALLRRLEARDDLWVALDVWEGEPERVEGLSAAVRFATPHIAGHSLDGKARGTEMLYEALCARLGRTPERRAADLLPAPPAPLDLPSPGDLEAGWRTITRAYDIEADTAALRATDALADAVRRAAFDALRRDYPPRRDFSVLQVRGEGPGAGLCAAFGMQQVDAP